LALAFGFFLLWSFSAPTKRLNRRISASFDVHDEVLSRVSASTQSIIFIPWQIRVARGPLIRTFIVLGSAVDLLRNLIAYLSTDYSTSKRNVAIAGVTIAVGNPERMEEQLPYEGS
jgi:hypothetical protein